MEILIAILMVLNIVSTVVKYAVVVMAVVNFPTNKRHLTMLRGLKKCLLCGQKRWLQTLVFTLPNVVDGEVVIDSFGSRARAKLSPPC
eukprot:1503540-Amphidinium_carterae.1